MLLTADWSAVTQSGLSKASVEQWWLWCWFQNTVQSAQRFLLNNQSRTWNIQLNQRGNSEVRNQTTHTWASLCLFVYLFIYLSCIWSFSFEHHVSVSVKTTGFIFCSPSVMVIMRHSVAPCWSQSVCVYLQTDNCGQVWTGVDRCEEEDVGGSDTQTMIFFFFFFFYVFLLLSIFWHKFFSLSLTEIFIPLFIVRVCSDVTHSSSIKTWREQMFFWLIPAVIKTDPGPALLEPGFISVQIIKQKTCKTMWEMNRGGLMEKSHLHFLILMFSVSLQTDRWCLIFSLFNSLTSSSFN